MIACFLQIDLLHIAKIQLIPLIVQELSQESIQKRQIKPQDTKCKKYWLYQKKSWKEALQTSSANLKVLSICLIQLILFHNTAKRLKRQSMFSQVKARWEFYYVGNFFKCWTNWSKIWFLIYNKIWNNYKNQYTKD